MTDPTDQPVEWAGVVLRLADGSLVAYEFSDYPEVHYQASYAPRSRDQLMEALRQGNLFELGQNTDVLITVEGRAGQWVTGFRAARTQHLEEAARLQAHQRTVPSQEP